LSNPLPPQELAGQTGSFLRKLPLEDAVAALRELAVHHPTLASALALDIVAAEHFPIDQGEDQPVQPQDSNEFEHIDTLTQLIHKAETFRLAGNDRRSLPFLAAARDTAQQLQAGLTSRIASSYSPPANGSDPEAGEEESGESPLSAQAPEPSLDIWEQAVRLAPDDPYHRANLVLALLDAGRVDEALTWLSGSAPDTIQPQPETQSHPA